MKRLIITSLCFVLGATCLNIAKVAAQNPNLFSASGDIGAVKHPGSADFDADSGHYILKGAGTNMWGTSDEFFMTWREVAGDFTLSADIAFEGAGVNAHRKMGLIIRDGLSGDAVYADVAAHGDGLTSLQYRPAQGAETLEAIGRPSGSVSPDRITLERRGESIVMRLENKARGANGEPVTRTDNEQVTATDNKPVTATEDDTVITLRLPETCLVGLFVCSHDPEVIETGIFNNVTLETPDVQSPDEPELPLLAL